MTRITISFDLSRDVDETGPMLAGAVADILNERPMGNSNGLRNIGSELVRLGLRYILDDFVDGDFAVAVSPKQAEFVPCQHAIPGGWCGKPSDRIVRTPAGIPLDT